MGESILFCKEYERRGCCCKEFKGVHKFRSGSRNIWSDLMWMKMWDSFNLTHHSQVLGDYIASIVSDESSEISSRLEVVESILTGYTDCVCVLLRDDIQDVSPFLSELHSFLESPPEINTPAEEEAEPDTDQHSELSLRERINRERMEAQKEVKVRKAM